MKDERYIQDAMSIIEDILASETHGETMIGGSYTTGQLYDQLIFDGEDNGEPYNLFLLHRYLFYIAPRNGLSFECEMENAIVGLPYNMPFRVMKE